MAKSVDDSILDAALDVGATCTRIDVTNDVATPTDLSGTLATATLTAGDGNGDYLITNGDTSGRKLAVSEQADLAITASGTALHIVLSLGGTILLTTTVTPQDLTLGGTVTIPTFDYEIADPI